MARAWRSIQHMGWGRKLLGKLKSVEAWRHFVSEVGVIILGVLIALFLGGIADDRGWRNEVKRARLALGLELGEAMGQVKERIRFSPCVERRLDQIAEVVDEAASTGRLRPLGDIRTPSYRSWPHGVGISIVESEVGAHFEREDLAAISSINEFFEIMGAVSNRELDVWTRLHALVGPGRPFPPAEAADLRIAIGEARLMNRRLALAGIRAMQTAEAYGLDYDAVSAWEYDQRPVSAFAICLPIASDAPPHYGHAPLANVIRRALDRPVTHP